MPNYDYHHVKCIHDFENVRSVSRRIEAECSNCKSISKQQLSAPAVIQNGFYEQGKIYIDRNKQTFKGAAR
ncbi:MULTISPECIES: FmdB family zinc ribbon protein [Enterobacter cloacae complex]|uniref:FmdB family zinc ribbon protein n=1 Tax=Enterobacter cloacae complex TaxID=354276 RepID=UPI0009082777|nr:MULTISPECIES: FmdB family zinc ribbon protein [Enterobacter cloacae complex]MBT1806996.1 hypothetical protein [Enterobacter hormaechei subsp. xiangfangensis]EKY4106917.1 hypothetical protein [Enterobacter hormaechei subsp. steigerwaltii]MBT2110005.1 hypothetical protein [Enterobacter hormaechei subsp. xiangfangensis]MCM7378515.1 hypothetical protein [Enterobacter hormaechei]MCM7590158.1 hypothetical protein [Enterobacter chuandaensis]